VKHPLNASAFLSKPCTALTASDTAALGLGGAQTHDNSDKLGSGCAFFVDQKGVNVEWETIDENGLTDLYAIKSMRGHWIPMTVVGYPAVETDATFDGYTGSCVIDVGVNDQLFFFTSMDGADNTNQACSIAKQAAAAVIKNLQAIQGSG
jgi:hypothetical protein